MFGFYAAIRRRSWRWIAAPLLLGAGWFLLAVKVIIPYFAKDAKLYQEGFIFSIYYKHLGNTVFEMFRTIAVHPVATLAFAFGHGKIFYVVTLFQSTCFLGLFSPAVLLMAVPIFAQNLLSVAWTHAQINYQYVALLVPFIFVSCVWTLKKILDNKALYGYRHCLLSIFVATAMLSGFILEAPQMHVLRTVRSYRIDDMAIEKRKLLQMIPPHASVMATFQFLPHLADRKELYSLHLVSTGYKMCTNEKYVPPQGLQYVLADFNESLLVGSFFPQQAPDNIRRFLKEGNWSVWAARDDVVLFRKGDGKNILLTEEASAVDIKNIFNINFANQIEFLGYDKSKEEGSQSDVLPLVYYWRRLGSSNFPLGLFLQFIGSDGLVALEKVHLFGYRAYVPEAFPEGAVIRERHYVSIPSTLKKDTYEIRLGMFIIGDGQLLPEGKSDKVDGLGRVLLEKISLGS
jgi:hypothetical protein